MKAASSDPLRRHDSVDVVQDEGSHVSGLRRADGQLEWALCLGVPQYKREVAGRAGPVG
jgi:hypothetical protein